MGVTLIGAVFVALAFWAVFVRRAAIPWVLSASAPFLTTSAVNVSGNGVPPFYVVAAITLTAGLLRPARKEPGHQTALPRRLLICFALWSLVVTAFCPWYFQGISVLTPRAGIDQVFSPGVLDFTISHAAQALYLLLGAGVALSLARTRGISTGVVALGFAVGSIMSTARAALGEAYPSWLTDNYGERNYWSSSYGGQARLQGIFSEPSYLAVFSLAAVVFFINALVLVRGRTRWIYLVCLGSAVLNLYLSYSGTAVLGALIVSALAVCAWVGSLIVGRHAIYPPALVAGLAVASALVWFAGPIAGGVSELVLDKQSSVSYLARSASNDFSWDVLWDTFGIGAGLGSNRPSSMFMLLLSCVGILGTGLFLAAALASTIRAYRRPALRPAAWALTALLAAKFVADPELSTPLMWLLIGVCLLPQADVASPVDDQLRGRAESEGTGLPRVRGSRRQTPRPILVREGVQAAAAPRRVP